MFRSINIDIYSLKIILIFIHIINNQKRNKGNV